VVKEQVIVTDQKWVTEVINYLKTKGRHYKAKHYGYSSFARMHHVYTNDVWVARVSAKRLLKLIKASESWKRSRYAYKIVQLLEQAGDACE
jgi:nicotinamide mononucleotide adenylyltransferase